MISLLEKIFFKKEGFFSQLAKIIFRISLITFIVLFLAEYVEPGFVTNWFNPILILLLALITGSLVLLIKKD